MSLELERYSAPAYFAFKLLALKEYIKHLPCSLEEHVYLETTLLSKNLQTRMTKIQLGDETFLVNFCPTKFFSSMLVQKSDNKSGQKRRKFRNNSCLLEFCLLRYIHSSQKWSLKMKKFKGDCVSSWLYCGSAMELSKLQDGSENIRTYNSNIELDCQDLFCLREQVCRSCQVGLIIFVLILQVIQKYQV